LHPQPHRRGADHLIGLTVGVTGTPALPRDGRKGFVLPQVRRAEPGELGLVCREDGARRHDLRRDGLEAEPLEALVRDALASLRG